MAEHDECVNGISCPSSAPSTIASCSTDHTCRLWQVGEGGASCTRAFEGHHTTVWGVSHSPGHDSIATVAQDGTVRLWDARATAGGDAGVAKTRSPLFCVEWLSDSSVAVAGEEGDIYVFDRRNMTQASEQVAGAHGDSVRRLVKGLDKAGAEVLASCSDDTTVCVRAVKSLDKDSASVKPHTDFVRALCFAAGKGQMLAGSWDKSLSRIDVA